ncbi:aminoglycoside phosphotransferase family protein [bacterium Scap17]|nr:aminoglycoside phosphotransferase family protein [bacterium Scap17]
MAAATQSSQDTHACTPLAKLRNGLALALDHAGITTSAIRPLPDSGLAHAHFRLELPPARHEETQEWIARLPKQSQMRLSAADNLTYQTACFERCQPSGHTPRLEGGLAPQPDLPRGGLLVEAIEGRPARLPEDLRAITEALASIHALPLPAVHKRVPLLAPDCPWRAMLDEIELQCRYLESAGLPLEGQRLIKGELQALKDFVAVQQAPVAISLISFDAHPGNFLIEEDRTNSVPTRAVLVDLEKCRYGLPGFDLAHATLYTSTTWDVASHAILTPEQVADAYRHWCQQMMATSADPALHDSQTLLQARRAMWLWSLSWCAKWLSLNCETRDNGHHGEDWSSELSEDRLIAHVRERARHYLTEHCIRGVIDEWQQLARALPWAT